MRNFVLALHIPNIPLPLTEEAFLTLFDKTACNAGYSDDPPPMLTSGMGAKQISLSITNGRYCERRIAAATTTSRSAPLRPACNKGAFQLL